MEATITDIQAYQAGRDAAARDAHADALAWFERASALGLDQADLWEAAARSARKLALYGQSEAFCRRALKHETDHAGALALLVLALREQGRLDEATTVAQQAVAAEPDDPRAHVRLAECQLAGGDYQAGLEELEWRLRIPGVSPNTEGLAVPRWAGEPLAGKRVLVVAEQGLGDTVQFCRFAPLVKAQGCHVTIAVPPNLVALLASLDGVDAVTGEIPAQPDADYHIPMASLPYLSGAAPGRIPAPERYLTPAPNRVQAWMAELKGGPKLKIGIAWQGRPDTLTAAGKEVPLDLLLPLADLEDVGLYSLQKGDNTAEALAGTGIPDLGARFTTFADTATTMAGLDLIIAPDTGLAHVAAAIGRPTWILLRFAPSWRWGTKGEGTFWYPTARLIRQPAPGNWAAVYRTLRDALRGT